MAEMSQSMKQSMIASASMQMFMRALQATSMELNQLVRQALISNPTLEESDAEKTDNNDDEGNYAENYEASQRHSQMLDNISERESLHEYLKKQIQQSAYPDELEEIALQLIDYINPHGYFDEDPAIIAEEAHIPADKAKKALAIIQELEPAGVGSRGIQESLLLQLARLGESKGIASELIAEHWEQLVKHRFAEAAKEMELDIEAIEGALHRISQLNPDIGSGFSSAEEHSFSPDLLLTRKNDKLSVALSGENIPQLSLSADYRSMMSEKADNAELRRYLSRCFREGRELIHAIEQRQQSILQVARALVVRQREFFLLGPQAIAALKMETLAEDTDMHISTISRAVNGKYIKCDYGTFELRSFFQSAFPCDKSTGEEERISSGVVQNRIRALIAEESSTKPLSDAKLEKLLATEGIKIARRTIAKYRDKMKIMPANMRKVHH